MLESWARPQTLGRSIRSAWTSQEALAVSWAQSEAAPVDKDTGSSTSTTLARARRSTKTKTISLTNILHCLHPTLRLHRQLVSPLEHPLLPRPRRAMTGTNGRISRIYMCLWTSQRYLLTLSIRFTLRVCSQVHLCL